MFESDDYDQVSIYYSKILLFNFLRRDNIKKLKYTFQVLSQIDFPELNANFLTKNEVPQKKAHESEKKENVQGVFKETEIVDFQTSNKHIETNVKIFNKGDQIFPSKNFPEKVNKTCEISPKHTKRKIINSYFDHKSKRKFPGPAGLLSGNFEEKRDDGVCHMELLSQVIH